MSSEWLPLALIAACVAFLLVRKLSAKMGAAAAAPAAGGAQPATAAGGAPTATSAGGSQTATAAAAPAAVGSEDAAAIRKLMDAARAKLQAGDADGAIACALAAGCGVDI